MHQGFSHKIVIFSFAFFNFLIVNIVLVLVLDIVSESKDTSASGSKGLILFKFSNFLSWVEMLTMAVMMRVSLE